jgi:hypothetical protein
LSANPAASRFIRWSYMGSDPGPGVNPWDLTGTIVTEKVTPGRVDVITRAANPSTLVFKMTYHPDWHLEVDGNTQPSFMASPSFIGVNVPAGMHVVSAIYRSNRFKDFLLLIAAAVLIVLIGWGPRLYDRFESILRERAS